MSGFKGEHSPSSEEDRVSDEKAGVIQTSYGQVLADPDVNLTEEEKRAAVCSLPSLWLSTLAPAQVTNSYNRRKSSCASST